MASLTLCKRHNPKKVVLTNRVHELLLRKNVLSEVKAYRQHECPLPAR